jgi:hypothetical protein
MNVPLKLNGDEIAGGLDIGGRDSRVFNTYAIQSWVARLALTAEMDGIKRHVIRPKASGELRAWIEPVGSEYILHVESPLGYTAELGPLALDADAFARASGPTYYDSGLNIMHFGFVNPHPLVRGRGTESFGPPPPTPELAPLRIDGIHTVPGGASGNFGVRYKASVTTADDDDVLAEFERMCIRCIPHQHLGPAFQRTVDGTHVTLRSGGGIHDFDLPEPFTRVANRIPTGQILVDQSLVSSALAMR